MDNAHKHKINYSEFIAATINVKEFLTEDRLDALFHTFDIDGSGKITKSDIRTSFSKFGKEVTDNELDDIFK